MQHKDSGGNAVYEAPALTVVEFRVERGFAPSGLREVQTSGNNDAIELVSEEGGSEFDDGDFF